MSSIVDIISVVAGLLTVFGAGALTGLLPQWFKDRWLLGATKGNSYLIVNHTLKIGANPNVIDNETSWTPLHYASFYKKVPIMELLLHYGANTESECNGTHTPLYYAISSEQGGNTEVELNSKRYSAVKLLLKGGAVVTLDHIYKAESESDSELPTILRLHKEVSESFSKKKERVIDLALNNIREVLENFIENEFEEYCRNLKGSG